MLVRQGHGLRDARGRRWGLLAAATLVIGGIVSPSVIADADASNTSSTSSTVDTPLDTTQPSPTETSSTTTTLTPIETSTTSTSITPTSTTVAPPVETTVPPSVDAPLTTTTAPPPASVEPTTTTSVAQRETGAANDERGVDAEGTIRPFDIGDPQYLLVNKSVDNESLIPGQVFTYRIGLTCVEKSCINAVLSDALPAGLDGYALQNVTMSSPMSSVVWDVHWTEDGDPVNEPTVIGPATALRVDFEQPTTAPLGIGLEFGTTFNITLSLQVPHELEPGTYSIENTANTTADNSAPDSSTANVTVNVAVALDVAATKSWTPSSQAFDSSAISTVSLGATNGSNVAVDTLVIQEPVAAVDGAANLDPSNPFAVTDFVDFVEPFAPLPAAATDVRVDAYVLDNGIWGWVTGTAGATPALPAGVDAADVGGLRFTYSGAEPGAIEVGAAASVSFDLVQRATHRNDGADLSLEQYTVSNVAEATVTSDGLDPVSDEADASLTVKPAKLSVEASKDINPTRISAGDVAVATITANNDSDIGVDELRLSDVDYFTEHVRFGRFTAPPVWPMGATQAKVVYHLSGGGSTELTFANTATPGLPTLPSGEWITGFEIVYTAATGGILAEAGTSAQFEIDTLEGATGDAVELVTNNTVTTTIIAPNGNTATDGADDDLTLVKPGLAVTLDKDIRPATSVEPGEAVVTSLSANLTTSSDYVTATQIVVEDAWDGAEADHQFWDAFDLSEIAPTQVPRNTLLTVEIQTGVDDWTELAVHPVAGTASIFSMTPVELSTALGLAGLDSDDVTGIRFTFDNQSADGFAANVPVTAYVVTTARDELRSAAGESTTTQPGEAVTYTNAATAAGAGQTPIDNQLFDDDDDTGDAQIITGEGAGVVGIDKTWLGQTVSAQSSQRRSTRLDWGVGTGYETVAITDPIDPSSPADTVFQAFDLRHLEPIAANPTPYSNGWYLRYDTITSIQLYRSGAWTTVTTPALGWIVDGAFVGYELTDSEAIDTTGIRVNLAENTTARNDAQQVGDDYDPYAPRPNTGIAASSGSRHFVLTWQIRDQMRDGGDWVTATKDYNVDNEPGFVENTVELVATPLAGALVTATDSDTIQILDLDPGVGVAKTVAPTELTYVPYPGTTDPENYPTATWTMTAHNDSVARASYVRVTDPPTCTDTADIANCQSAGTAVGALENPFSVANDWLDPTGSTANPFERYDLVALSIGASLGDEVDLDETTVWLLRYNTVTGEYTSTPAITANVANGLDAADLADVVGVSVTFQGADPATTGGTITAANDLTVTMGARLRTTLRSSGEPQQLGAGETATVTNRVFAQSYDPILNDGTVTGDLAKVVNTLTGGAINVAPTKTVSPSTITEPDRDQTVTVTLGANQGSMPRSTLSPNSVWISDNIVSSPDFWDRFDLTGLGTVQPPNGADRVTVAVCGPCGTIEPLNWIDDGPTEIAAAALPDVDLSLVEGIRFSFTKADDDGGEPFFSSQLPAPNWSTTAPFTVQLRDTYRSTGEPITFDEPTLVENTVTAQSLRPDEASAEKETDASVNLVAGTRELSVSKLTNSNNRFATVGSPVPFDLTYHNNGTGYLTIEELRDTLPAALQYLGEPAPEATADPDGTLPADVTVTQDGQEVIFTWPEGDRTMAPGETFNIRIWLELQPVGSGVSVTNTMTVRTAETLESCGHIGSGAVTGAWGEDAATCGTTDYVTPATGANLFTIKGVQGSLEGAIVPGNPSANCSPSLAATGGDYYRTPCAANSVIGGTDHWVLQTVNAGTVDVAEMTIFDQLPVAGDQFLVSGTSRNSAYRPQLVGAPQIAAPPETTWTIEVTTSAGVCAGTWAGLTSSDVCEQNGEQWAVADGSTDWSQVSGLRIVFDFSGTAAGVLESGQGVDITYSSVNVEATTDDASGASTVVPAVDAFAWNQFGVKYRNVDSAAYRKIAPNVVGVHLMTGPIQIDKVIVGDGAAYAPDAFLVDVVCSIGDTPLDLGDAATVTLDADNGYSTRIDGIPVGASCALTEQGDLGAFGESGREEPTADLAVEIPAGPEADVPAAQIAMITNEYEMSDLMVTKRIDTTATGAELGPFAFSLSCTTLLEYPVEFGDGITELSFTLAGGQTFTTPPGSIPVGASCLLTETDAANANSVTITGDGVTDLGDGTATIELAGETAEAIVANRFEAGELVVEKLVTGAGAESYGAGPFQFSAACTYFDQTLLDEEFELRGDERRAFGPYPTGTDCVVTELDSGGATSSRLEPVDGLVTIDVEEAAVVTATNVFDLVSIEVTKSVIGEPTTTDVRFTVSLSCTVDRRGVSTPVVIPGGDARELIAPDQLTATYESLPTGASCTITETDRGGADLTMIGVDGVSTIAGDSAVLTTPESGSVEVNIVNEYESSGSDAVPPTTPTTSTTPSTSTAPSTSTTFPGYSGRPLPGTGSDMGGALSIGVATLLAGLALLALRRNANRRFSTVGR